MINQKESNLKEIKDNQDFNNYNKELVEDLKLTKMNIGEKSLMVPSIKIKWNNYYFKEKDNLKRIKAVKEKILRSKIGSGQSSSILKMKSEDALAANDEQIKKLNLMMENVKTNIEFLERAMNTVGDLTWDVKNAVEILKMEKF